MKATFLPIFSPRVLTFVMLLFMAGCATTPAPDDAGAYSLPPHDAATDGVREPAVDPVAEPSGSLTLRDALALALVQSPELAPYAWQARVDSARIMQAGLRPNPEVALHVEDVAGTGGFSGVSGAQTTLQLSQVIELGGKQDARKEAASQARGVTASDYELKRVEFLGDVTQRFIQVVARQLEVELAESTLELSRNALGTVRDRMAAGSGSALEEKKAELALSRAEVLLEGAQHDLTAARKVLAASWRSAHPKFERAEADLFAHGPIPSFDELTARIATSPEVVRWVSERKLRDAELQLAEARRRPNITVSGGIRRFEGPDDLALVLGVSMPWRIHDSGEGAAAEARALLGRTEAEREAAEFRLGAVLVGLYEEMIHELHVMEGVRTEIQPHAEAALALANEGYAKGRYSYLEVLDAQRTLFEIRQEHIRTAASFHRLVAEIEQLLGLPFEAGVAQP
ncbi:MAG TPA: TolC family protein [Opitutaceae bacterium]|nr:TolC family protein [Opitutaceae bacterium]